MADFTFSMRTVGPSPEDPLSIYHLGQSFYLAGGRCALNIETGPKTVQSLLSPSVVNYCFSLELFLKALIRAEGRKPPRTHRLDDLYAAIPETSRIAVREGYATTVREPKLDETAGQASRHTSLMKRELVVQLPGRVRASQAHGAVDLGRWVPYGRTGDPGLLRLEPGARTDAGRPTVGRQRASRC